DHSGIAPGSTLACAAVTATVRRLLDEPPYAELQRLGTKLQAGLRALARRHAIPLHLQGPPSAFHAGLGRGPVTDHVTWHELDLAGYTAFTGVLAQHGVWASASGMWFLSAAH